jgi:hypothetical protein
LMVYGLVLKFSFGPFGNGPEKISKKLNEILKILIVNILTNFFSIPFLGFCQVFFYSSKKKSKNIYNQRFDYLGVNGCRPSKNQRTTPRLERMGLGVLFNAKKIQRNAARDEGNAGNGYF